MSRHGLSAESRQLTRVGVSGQHDRVGSSPSGGEGKRPLIHRCGCVTKRFIDPLTVLRSTLPPRQLGLVMEWAAQHQDALGANWDSAQHHGPLAPIPPLP
jgi:hypothetical protein